MITGTGLFYIVMDNFEADEFYLELRNALDVGSILSREFIKEYPNVTKLLQALRKHKEGE